MHPERPERDVVGRFETTEVSLQRKDLENTNIIYMNIAVKERQWSLPKREYRQGPYELANQKR
jgi:hypothetical protein